VFQHGLGGDLEQPFGVYRPIAGVCLIAFDMRGHGETRPLGDSNELSIATLADDLAALLDELQVERAVIGGISLGSAVAVKVALTRPDKVLGLVLSRPAWLDWPLPENVRLYATIAGLIRQRGPAEGAERFRLSPEYQLMESTSPDCARSLIGQFESARAVECVARLERLASDRLCLDLSEYSAIAVPALVLGNHQDPIHPWFLAARLAQLIPGSELHEITPKSVSVDRHAADVQAAINGFLTNRFLLARGSPC
jgi:pimeloyl-ACP methyl ester carboxylesterase